MHSIKQIKKKYKKKIRLCDINIKNSKISCDLNKLSVLAIKIKLFVLN